MSSPRYRYGLRIKLFGALALAGALAAALVVFLWSPTFLAAERDHHLYHIRSHLDTLAATMLPHILGGDLAAVHATFDELLAKNETWEALELKAADGRLLYPVEPVPPRAATGDRLVVTRPVTFQGKQFGEIVLHLDMRPRIRKEVLVVHRLEAVLVAGFVLVLIVAGGVIDFLVRRPVEALGRATRRLAEGEFETALPAPRDDEIGGLIRSFTAMRRQLAEGWSALEGEIVERVKAYEEAQAEARRVELLRRVAVAANTAATVEDAFRVCLAEICDLVGWPLGHAYFVVGGRLRSSDVWHVRDGERPEEFVDATDALRFEVGEELPGRVLAQHAPVWIADVREDPEFFRGPAARSAGLAAAFGFPVLVGAEVAAVLEFFSHDVVASDKELVELVANVGTQLGRVVERKRAEHALQRSESRFRGLVETTHDWVWEVDENAVYTYVNPRAREMLGYEPHDILGKTPFDLMPADEAKRVADIFESIVAARKPFALLENIVLHKDGRRVVLETSGVPIFDADGGFRGYRGIDRDITERKRAEEDVRASEARYRAVLENAQDGIVIARPDGSIVEANQQVERLLGYSRAELRGMRASDLHPATEQGAVRAAFRDMSEKGHSLFEHDALRKDGGRVPVEVAGSKVETPDGVMFVGVFRDLTMRKQAEAVLRRSKEELEQEVRRRVAEIQDMNERLLGEIKERQAAEVRVKASERELRAILDNMHDTFYRTDLEGRLIRLSPSVRALLGYSADEVLGKSMASFYRRPEERTEFLKGLKSGGGKYLDHRTELVHKDGHGVWVSTNAQFYHDDEDNVAGVEGTTRDITRQRLAEDALRRSEERLSKVFHASGAAISISTVAEGRFIDVNESFLSTAGYERDEVIGHTADELGLWIRPGGRRDLVARLRKLGSLREIETSIRAKDGEARDVVMSMEPVEIEGIDCILAVTQDITEHKRALEALRRAMAELQDQKFALDQHSIVAIADRRGRITYANDKFCQVSGYSQEELLGRDHRVLNSGHHPRKFFARMWRTIAAGEVWHGEILNRTKSGGFYWVDTTIVPFRDDDGEVYQYVSIRTDITAHKRAEEELRLREQRYRALAENLPAAVFHAEEDDGVKLTLFNDMLDAITGYPALFPAVDGGGCPLESLVVEADRDRLRAETQRVLREGGAYEIEYRIGHRDGSLRYLLEMGRGNCGLDGQRPSIDGVIFDITERKQTQLALERARDEAADALRVKSEFIANMSHEIRTPLNGIIGMTGVLLEEPLSAEQREYVQTMVTSGNHLMSVVDEILDFSKISAGRLVLEPTAIQVRDVVEEVLDMFATQAQEKSVELAAVLPPSDCGIAWVDPVRLKQILVNLVGNAIKFTDKGEITVSVLPVQMLDRAPMLRFEIRDTGTGMGPEEEGYVFDAFRQADGSITRKIGGTGLGLAITKSLVEAMGGEIGLQSAPDVGSTFWFTVPAADAQTDLGFEAAVAPRRALLVSQSPTVSLALEHQLVELGFEVQACKGGPPEQRPAADLVAYGFDAVVIDRSLGSDCGEDACAELEQLRQTGAKLVEVVPRGGCDSACPCRQYVDVLVKPIHLRALRQCLDQGPANDGGTNGADRAEPLAQVASKPSVLLADDNEVNRKVIARMLERLGCEPHPVTNGQQAVEAAAAGDYDLVVMDCHMPVLDGFAAAAEIRRQELASGRRPVPIMAVTADALPGTRERCLAAGMDDYLTKPLCLDVLGERIAEYLPRLRTTVSTVDSVGIARPAATVLNSARLADLHDSLGEDLEAVIAVYLESAPKIFAGLCSAVETGDAAAVASTAHTLKGASANIGADGLARRCQELESLLRRGIDARNLAPALDEMSEHLGRVLAALADWPESAAGG